MTLRQALTAAAVVALAGLLPTVQPRPDSRARASSTVAIAFSAPLPRVDEERRFTAAASRSRPPAVAAPPQLPAPQRPDQPVRPAAVTKPRTPPVSYRVTAGGLAAAFACLRRFESGGDYSNRRNSRYRGAYQFSYATWRSVGGTGDPAAAPPAEQDARAALLQARSGWGQWPVTSRLCGLR